MAIEPSKTMWWSFRLFLVLLPITLGQVQLVRKDKEMLCLSNQTSRDVVIAPIYKLETIDVIKLNTGAWTKLWNASAGTESETIPDANWKFKDWNELPQFATNGTSSHILLADLSVHGNTRESFYVSVLAQSASFLLTSFQNWIGNPGLILQMDHISNVESDLKQLKVLKCFKLDLKDSGCVLVHDQSVELLENGFEWTHLNFSCAEGLNDKTSCKISKYGSKMTSSFSVQLEKSHFYNLRYVAVKAVGKPGIFKLHSTTKFSSNHKKNLTFTREFYQQRGLFCIDINWNKGMSDNVEFNIFNSSLRVFTNYYNNSHSINTHVEYYYGNSETIIVYLITTFLNNAIVSIKNCSNTHGNFQLDYGNEGAEIIGCQKISDQSNHDPILATGCLFTKESAFDCDILKIHFSLPCQKLLFCDGNTNTIYKFQPSEVTSATTPTVKQSESTERPTNESSTVKSVLDEAQCNCRANSMPVSVDFLWGLVGLNFCLICGVTIRWWIIWKKNDHCDFEDE